MGVAVHFVDLAGFGGVVARIIGRAVTWPPGFMKHANLAFFSERD